MSSRSNQTTEPESPPGGSYQALQAAIQADRALLFAHPIYEHVHDLRALRGFMGAHVFAVWDFMTLLKSLQRRLTCVALPWTRPRYPRAARLINEIVLAEESDEVEPGRFLSHFELYVEAMTEIGCDTSGVLAVHDAVARGADVKHALAAADVPEGVQRFVRRTVDLAQGGTDVQLAAEFLFGREDPIPTMFQALGERLPAVVAAPSFRLYLQRHVELDGEQHGPAAAALLTALCGEDAALWRQATLAARSAIRARAALWDALLPRLLP